MTNSTDNAGLLKKYGRLAVIPLLLGVLLVVCCWPSSESKVSTKKPKPAITTTIAEKPAATNDVAQKQRGSVSFTLDDALAYDIFNPLPKEQKNSADGTPSSDVASDGAASIQEVPHGQVQAIFKSSSGRVAIIDSQIVRVGDSIARGRIVEMTDETVLIATE